MKTTSQPALAQQEFAIPDTMPFIMMRLIRLCYAELQPQAQVYIQIITHHERHNSRTILISLTCKEQMPDSDLPNASAAMQCVITKG
jgi:hypothetical protein